MLQQVALTPLSLQDVFLAYSIVIFRTMPCKVQKMVKWVMVYPIAICEIIRLNVEVLFNGVEE
jgi:hypothetical protein